jgi:hypothetical protein
MSLIQVQAGEVTPKHVSADVSVNDGRKTRDYYLFVAATYVTVVAGPVTRRSLGKTFHQIDEVGTHYKRDGRVLLEVIGQLNQMRTDCK